jgi:hypothetical protein
MAIVRQGRLGRTVATALVYDFETGKLIHLHQHIALEGGYVPDHEQVEQKALANAMIRQGRDQSRMRVLHLSEDAMRPGKIYKVDVRNLVLVEIGTRPLPGARAR